MAIYKYYTCIEYNYQSRKTGVSFSSSWMDVKPDGMIIVKGAVDREYAWDGCSPKIKFLSIIIGTWDGFLVGVDDCKEKARGETWRASLFHDALSQFWVQLNALGWSREDSAEVFKAILQEDGFALWRAYDAAVRMWDRVMMTVKRLSKPTVLST